ncbi:putative acting on peptide bonds (peptidase) [Helianthus annuus]|nr:putative acting on peptide bonds (peptidase) [Helianthus annuus]
MEAVAKSFTSDFTFLQRKMASFVTQAVVSETITFLLMMTGTLVETDQRFLLSELHKKNKTEPEAKDGSDTEDDNDDENEDDAGEPEEEEDNAGDDDFSGEEGEEDDVVGDPDENPEVNGDEDDEDDDDDDDDLYAYIFDYLG